MSSGYNFKESIKTGKNGELLIANLFPNIFKMSEDDGYTGDLIYRDEYKFELKTDKYKSGNFFFEEISNMRKKSKGGVWQSEEHGCKYYAFYMLRYDKLFIFEIKTLLEWLENNKQFHRTFNVENVDKYTFGYIIPIKDVEHICVKIIDLSSMENYENLKNNYF